ncbi:Rrf2 family transcriptional regulator [Pleomorphomonas sp. JP5]|uniref:Rrf2 family transcriptional regulator n=1 Tax=Pleomorphomonas sp. JP5 TaxID=2942998 RepID=UPI002042DB64|nr:Rrf2 family transcriptional regulator [Pleomorphomonas sp. JP5]MCM5557630.1 Rrf2 family transcriptional regulator [Pleomorphomonas sp. JP5]
MRHDGRLSRMLHVLLHMEEQKRPMTSDEIAGMLGTNPALVRRTLAGLREGGYVVSERGHGGGWMLGKPLSEMTLRDVYDAVGAPEIFALGLADDQPQCLVEQAVNMALRQSLDEAKALLLRRFAEIRVSDLRDDFAARAAALGIIPGMSCADA